MSTTSNLNTIADAAAALSEAVDAARAAGFRVHLEFLPADYKDIAERQFGVKLPRYLLSVMKVAGEGGLG